MCNTYFTNALSLKARARSCFIEHERALAYFLLNKYLLTVLDVNALTWVSYANTLEVVVYILLTSNSVVVDVDVRDTSSSIVSCDSICECSVSSVYLILEYVCISINSLCLCEGISNSSPSGLRSVRIIFYRSTQSLSLCDCCSEGGLVYICRSYELCQPTWVTSLLASLLSAFTDGEVASSCVSE